MLNQSNTRYNILTYIGVSLFAIVIQVLYIKNKSVGLSPAFALDDALITFRYSLNLAQGNGFVYNVGEHVLGTTTPLFALLCSIPAFLGINLINFAAVFNSFANIATALLLVYIFRGFFVAQLAAPVLFILHPYILYFASAGMEMSLITFLGVLTAALYWTKHERLAGLTAGLMLVGRIDAILLVGALMATALILERRLLWRFTLVMALTVLPWVIFAFAYFGSVIPQSALAKQVWRIGAHPLSVWLIPDALLLLVLAVVGIVSAMLNPFRDESSGLRGWLLTLALWLIAFGAFFMGTRAEVEDWYRVPQCAIVAVLAAWGLQTLVRYFIRQIHEKFTLWATGLVAVFLVLIGNNFSEIVSVPNQIGDLFQPAAHASVFDFYMQTAWWLRDHAQPTDTVMAGNIGFIGYYYRGYILDDVGLVSPQTLPHVISNGLLRGVLISTFHPDILALENREYLEMQETVQAEGYRLVAEFASADYYPMSPYRIFVKSRRLTN